MYAAVIYGCHRVYESPDQDLMDTLVDLEDQYSEKGCRLYLGNAAEFGAERWTLTFGFPITILTPHEPRFGMREILVNIDQKTFMLRPDMEEQWKTMMMEIPYDWREELSRPEFYVVWASDN